MLIQIYVQGMKLSKFIPFFSSDFYLIRNLLDSSKWGVQSPGGTGESSFRLSE
jgi:hypothetical protein